MKFLIFPLTFILLLSGCAKQSLYTSDAPIRVVVTTGILECAARELLPEGTAEITVLIPPGSCPGHFDVAPETLISVRGADVLIYHDFQEGLATRLKTVLPDEAQAMRVESSGSLNLPDNYDSLLERLSKLFTPTLDEMTRGEMEDRLQSAKQQLLELSAELDYTRRLLAGHRIAVSVMQQEFVEYLGLIAVAHLNRPEAMTPADLEQLRSTAFEAIIGNIQSDAGPAELIGTQMKKPVILLSNFPGTPGFGDTYADHLRTNLERLKNALNDDEE